MLVTMLALLLTTVPVPTVAQSQIAAAIGSGEVGERFDGYMGFAVAPNDEVRRQVTAINIQRRNLYLELAAQRNVTAQLVGVTTACTLFHQLAVGEAYMLEDKVWRRRGARQPAPTSDNCR